MKNHPIGFKLVRGCYMYEERELAAEKKYSDPINPSLEATAARFDRNFQYVIDHKSPKS
jgi:proline dehydrogenase